MSLSSLAGFVGVSFIAVVGEPPGLERIWRGVLRLPPRASRCGKAPATVGRYRASRLFRAPLIRQCRLRGKSSQPYLLSISIFAAKAAGFARRHGSCQRRLGGLDADRRSQRVGYGLAETLNVGLLFGFDHYPGQRFGAGIAEDDAAIVAERGFGFGQGAGNFW